MKKEKIITGGKRPDKKDYRESFFIDPSLERKSAIVDGAFHLDGKLVPIPSVVELSASGTCNRSCDFCPRSNPSYPDLKEFIDPSFLDNISKQLNTIGFQGIFLFSGFVEPLLDKNIFSLVSIVHTFLNLFWFAPFLNIEGWGV